MSRSLGASCTLPKLLLLGCKEGLSVREKKISFEMSDISIAPFVTYETLQIELKGEFHEGKIIEQEPLGNHRDHGQEKEL